MKLVVLQDELAVARLDASDRTPAWATQGSISSVTRTADELSVVCATAGVPANVQAERGWRCLRVVGRLDFSLESCAGPSTLAGSGIRHPLRPSST